MKLYCSENKTDVMRSKIIYLGWWILIKMDALSIAQNISICTTRCISPAEPSMKRSRTNLWHIQPGIVPYLLLSSRERKHITRVISHLHACPCNFFCSPPMMGLKIYSREKILFPQLSYITLEDQIFEPENLVQSHKRDLANPHILLDPSLA